MLYAAGSAALASGAFPGRHDLAARAAEDRLLRRWRARHARASAIELGAVPRDTRAPRAPRDALGRSQRARKCVELVYGSPKSAQPSTRKVDPYGLALRRGVWSLVGYCHLRQGLRTFHVHRIRALKMNPAASPGVTTSRCRRTSSRRLTSPPCPWQCGIEPPVEVRLELQGRARHAGRRRTSPTGDWSEGRPDRGGAQGHAPGRAAQARARALAAGRASSSPGVGAGPASGALAQAVAATARRHRHERRARAPPPPPLRRPLRRPAPRGDGGRAGASSWGSAARSCSGTSSCSPWWAGRRSSRTTSSTLRGERPGLRRPRPALQQAAAADRPEAAALAAAAELLRPAGGDALASALAKLEKVLPAQAQKTYREMGERGERPLAGPGGAGHPDPGGRASGGSSSSTTPAVAARRPSTAASSRWRSSATAASGTSTACD